MSTPTDDLIREYVALRDKADAINDRLDQLKRELGQLGNGQHATNAGTVTVSTRKTLDKKRTQQALPADLWDACHSLTFDTTKARTLIAPALWASLCDESAPIVKVTLP